VRETVVLAQEDVSDHQLGSLCGCGQQPAPSISDLRRFLIEKLPEYMVPAVFVQIEALLTPEWVDRQALPAPDATRLDKAFVAPPLREAKLAEIWGVLCGAGGHS